MRLIARTRYKEPGQVVLGRTLPSLLDEACRANPTPHAFNQWTGKRWESLSSEDFRVRSQELALGLLERDLAKGDRVCLFMHSDLYFAVADMACLVAGLIDVPIYLTHTPDTIRYVLRHAQARALMVSDIELLGRLSGALSALPQLKTIIVAEPGGELPSWPILEEKGIALLSMRKVTEQGRRRLEADPEAAERLESEIHAHETATIVYTSGTTGPPKGVMLSHENLSFNSLASFSGLDGLDKGQGHTALSFLPLTHVFARMMHYGYLNYGMPVYFTTVEMLGEHLKSVQPTTFATVPRVLEKFFDKIRQKGAEQRGLKRGVFNWSLRLARRYQLGRKRQKISSLSQRLSDRLVFSKWREALGGRLQFVISGGAALRPDLANVFAAAGIQVLQGYGLTETSPVITFNRPPLNRAGTVGLPLAGVEVKIAEDGEVLTRGPHVMKGYYRNPQGTRECIDAEGWFHTGDIGRFTDEGLLEITDRKKSLFKLSTGKYVTPQPLEDQLNHSPLIDQVVIVGRGEKFCAALVFPDLLEVGRLGQELDVEADTPEAILEEPSVLEVFQQLVDEANRGLPPWSTIKRFELIATPLTVESGLLTPTLKVKRPQVEAAFASEIERMYEEEAPAGV